jgi:hypothetical protein
MERRQWLYLFIGISAFVALYLFYVDYGRKESIKRHLPQPVVGDIYKIKRNDENGNQWLVYFKLVEISGERLVFNHSKMQTDASVDYLQNHYNINEPIIYTRKEINDIAAGKWNTYQRDNTILVEIMRR